MPKCAVKKCKNYTLKVQKKDGVSYFHFPRDEIQKDRWRCIIARDREDESYRPNASSVVCSEHFCEDDVYLTKKGFKRIKKTAVPSIKLAESGTEEIKANNVNTECNVMIWKKIQKTISLPTCSTDLKKKGHMLHRYDHRIWNHP